MELILKEWLGADGHLVSLLDNRILEFNARNYLHDEFNKINSSLKKLDNKKREAINKLVKDKTTFNKIFSDNEEIGWEILKEKLKERIKENTASIFNESADIIVKKIGEINERHKNGDTQKNPICEIKKIGEIKKNLKKR